MNSAEKVFFKEIDTVIRSYFPDIKDDPERKANFILSILEIEVDNIGGDVSNSDLPNMERRTEFFRIHHPSGLGGGNSLKIRNIFINWRKILRDNLLEGAAGVLGSLTSPYVLVLSVLAIAKNIYKESNIEIDEKHSIVFVELWNLSNQGNNTVPGNILNSLNTLLNTLNKNLLTQIEFNIILDDLQKLGSIRLNSDGTITIIEKVTIK